MPRARRSNRGLCFALVLSLALPARAAGESDQAKKEFSVGEKAFEQADYVSALDHFRKAYELAPRDAVHFNIGVCLERLGRFKEASEEYDAAAKSTELDAPKRDRASSESARVRGRLGKLSVDATPAGGELFVDGARACSMPCELALDPRSHEVLARKDSVEKTKSITLVSGETTRLDFDLSAPAAPKPAAEPPKPVAPPSPKPDRASEKSGGPPGALTWVGGGVALVGTAAFIGFYFRTKKLESDYAENKSSDTRDEGRRMGTLTNISLGVAAVGLGLVAVDWLFVSKKSSATTARAREIGAFAF